MEIRKTWLSCLAMWDKMSPALGKYSVHQNADVMRYIRQYGQRKAMAEQHWTVDEFRAEFGQNYFDEE